jgi:UDP-glucose 4-epimerase
VADGAEVIVLDNFRTGRRENLSGLDCHVVEGSVEDSALLMELTEGTDYVVHLAAQVSAPESFDRPAETERANVLGTLNVLEAARRARVRKVLFASSASIYGNSDRDENGELHAPAPESPFAISKLSGEHYMALYQRLYRIPTVCMRLFTLYGPRQSARVPQTNVVASFAERARKNEPLMIYGDGAQTRDLLFVKDAVTALRLLAENGDGVFNVCGETRKSITGIAYEVISVAASRSRILHQAERKGEIRHLHGSSSRLRKLGWTPTTNFREGLERTLFSIPRRSDLTT